MENRSARFTGGTNSTMTVMLDSGSKGHNLKVTVRTPGEKTTTGMRSTHTNEAEADTKFKALCANAIKQGWTAKAGRATFTEMPAAPAKTAKTATK